MLKLFFLFFATLAFGAGIQNPSYVDTKKFSGLWYEIARTYNSYEKECVASSVEYLLEDDGYDVYNRCLQNSFDGKLIEYHGKGTSLNGKDMSGLKLTYFYVFSKKYRVIYLNDYKFAVLSDDGYKNLWIMSRTPKMPKAELAMILNSLNKKMDTQKLIFTPQNERKKER